MYTAILTKDGEVRFALYTGFAAAYTVGAANRIQVYHRLNSKLLTFDQVLLGLILEDLETDDLEFFNLRTMGQKVADFMRAGWSIEHVGVASMVEVGVRPRDPALETT